MKFYSICFFLLALISITACKTDEQTNWDVDVLAPLAKSKLTIANIISDSLIQTNSDHSISVAYNDTVFSLNFDSIFQMPDTTINTYFKSPIITLVQPGQQFFAKTDKVKLKIPDVLLSNVEALSGKIKFYIRSSINEKTKFIYEIPRALKNGSSLKITKYIPACKNGVPGETYGEIDVSGYNFDLTGEFFNSANTLMANTKVYNDSSSNAVNISTNDSIKFFVTFDNVVPNYAKGYFGMQSQASGVKSSNFDIFKNIISGSIDLSGINLSVSIVNYLGVDAKLILQSLISNNTNTGHSVPLNSAIINKHINISRAKSNGVNANGVEPSILKLDIEALAAKLFIENLPNQLKYNLNIFMNPLGNISGGNDFIYYGKGFMVILKFNMPLSFSSNALTIADTANFTYNAKTFDNINGGKLNVIAYNTFPIKAKLTMKLLDENKNIIENINLPQIIEAASNANYSNDLIPNKSILPILINADRLANFRKTKYIAFSASFTSMPQNQQITIYDNHYLELKLSADFSYNVNN
ncbi:MAG: hypothetical protein WCK02_01310 [Bacteroidota bacterium]